MLPKKNPNLDIANYKFIFFSIGLIFSLLIVNMVFSWKTYKPIEQDITLAGADTESTTMQEVPRTEIPPPPLPPMHTPLENPEIIEVNNDKVLQDFRVNFDVELTDETPHVKGTGLENKGAFNPTVISKPPKRKPPKKIIEDKIFIIVEEKPEPIGGMEAFYKYIKENLKYPKQARRNKMSGRVYIEFIVEKDGSLGHFKVLKGIGFGCDKEAIRVLSEAPKWKPGRQRGELVKVKMSVPIIFVLK